MTRRLPAKDPVKILSEPEPSISNNPIELDESIKKVIKDHQITDEINKVNLTLNTSRKIIHRQRNQVIR